MEKLMVHCSGWQFDGLVGICFSQCAQALKGQWFFALLRSLVHFLDWNLNDSSYFSRNSKEMAIDGALLMEVI
jgi:hypothetical protein